MDANTEPAENERYIPLPAMRLTIEIVGYSSSSVTLPDDVAAWLVEVADLSHTFPATLAGAVIGDVAREDNKMHESDRRDAEFMN